MHSNTPSAAGTKFAAAPDWLAFIGAAVQPSVFSGWTGWVRTQAVAARIPILMYHEVQRNPIPGNSEWVSAALFASQLDALEAYGYTTLDLDDYLAIRNGTMQPVEHPVILTFDDGYYTFLTDAYPQLRSRGMKATIFLPTAFLYPVNGGRYGDHLTWSDLPAMQPALIDSESHSVSHVDLTTLSSTALAAELANSRRDIEAHMPGTSVHHLAYPFGVYNQGVENAARAAGYQTAVAAWGGIANTQSSDLYALPRIGVSMENTLSLDPSAPRQFFMRLVDPSFPLPFAELNGYKAYDSAGVERVTFAPGETVRVVATVSNYGNPANVTGSLEIDHDMDEDTPSLLGRRDVVKRPFSNSDRTFSYTWEIPEDAPSGQFYASFRLQDEYEVLDYYDTSWMPVFRVQTASLTVTVHNVSGESAAEPGSNGRVSLYTSSGSLVATQTTTLVNTSDGTTTFYNLNAGRYYYRVWKTAGIWGDEYWGRSDVLEVGSGRTTVVDFTRMEPWVSNTLIKDDVTGNIVSEIVAGQAVRIEITVRNGARVDRTSQVRFTLDADRSAPYDYSQVSTSQLIAANGGTSTFVFSYTPTTAGTTYYATSETSSFVDIAMTRTDSSGWIDLFSTQGIEAQIPVLMYQEVQQNPIPGNSQWVSTALFTRQLAALEAYGYTALNLDDYLAIRTGAMPPVEHPVILTFDDGDYDFLTDAYPQLYARGMKATVFLPTTFLYPVNGRRNNNHLLWSELPGMQRSVVKFEAHSVTHADLTALNATALAAEVTNSRRDIEAHLPGTSVHYLSYPFGAYNQNTINAVRTAGYQAAVTAWGGIANTRTSNVYAIPRIGVSMENTVSLDPEEPDQFFMRLVDPSFPLPNADLVSLKAYDTAGVERVTFAPGETVRVVATVTNNGDPASVIGSLEIDHDTGEDTPSLFGRRDVVKKPFSGESQTFSYTWEIPEDAPSGQFYASFRLQDEYEVLEYYATGWMPVFSVALGSFNKSDPMNGVLLRQDRVNLSWGRSAGAVRYRYCIDTVDNDACDRSWVLVDDTSVTVNDLLLGKKYYWQVQAVKENFDPKYAGGGWWSFDVHHVIYLPAIAN